MTLPLPTDHPGVLHLPHIGDHLPALVTYPTVASLAAWAGTYRGKSHLQERKGNTTEYKDYTTKSMQC